jgi:hypothetical protein
MSSIYDRALVGEELRLLHFSPTGGGKSSDALSFKLSPHPLPPKLDYLALSYVWGKQKPARKLMINTCEFEVGPALERALSNLQNELSLPIWIDAICINQEDKPEQTAQILRMRTIYQSAKKTLIWLGEAADYSDSAMTYLDRIGREAFKAKILDLDIEDMKGWNRTGDDAGKEKIKSDVRGLFSKIGGSEWGTFPLEPILKLSEREWFTRAWVVQELSVASDYAFFCGSISVPGNHFLAGFYISLLWLADELAFATENPSLLSFAYWAARLTQRNGLAFSKTVMWRTFSSQDAAVTVVPSPRAMTTLGTRKRYKDMSLLQHLTRAYVPSSSCTTLQATCPEDRVIALVGMAKNHLDFAGMFSYDKDDYHRVYKDTAKALVCNGDLDVLSLCRSGYSRKLNSQEKAELPPCAHQPRCTPKIDGNWDPKDQCAYLRDRTRDRDPKLPSWAPNWKERISPPWGQNVEDALFKVPGDEKFTEGRQNNLNTPEDVLAIRVRVVGRVRALGGIIGTGVAWNPTSLKTFDWVAAAILLTQVENLVNGTDKFPAENKYSAEQRAEAVWKIPIGDKEMNELGLRQRATSKSNNEYTELISMLKMKTAVGMPPNVVGYMSSMAEMQDAKPFITETGYIGLCPDDSQQGDYVLFPVGAHVPYVFRKIDDEYWKLIGESYVYGLMDGEISTASPAVLTMLLK